MGHITPLLDNGRLDKLNNVGEGEFADALLEESVKARRAGYTKWELGSDLSGLTRKRGRHVSGMPTISEPSSTDSNDALSLLRVATFKKARTERPNLNTDALRNKTPLQDHQSPVLITDVDGEPSSPLPELEFDDHNNDGINDDDDDTVLAPSRPVSRMSFDRYMIGPTQDKSEKQAHSFSLYNGNVIDGVSKGVVRDENRNVTETGSVRSERENTLLSTEYSLRSLGQALEVIKFGEVYGAAGEEAGVSIVDIGAASNCAMAHAPISSTISFRA